MAIERDASGMKLASVSSQDGRTRPQARTRRSAAQRLDTAAQSRRGIEPVTQGIYAAHALTAVSSGIGTSCTRLAGRVA